MAREMKEGRRLLVQYTSTMQDSIVKPPSSDIPKIVEGLAKLDAGKSQTDDSKTVEEKVEEVARAIGNQVSDS